MASKKMENEELHLYTYDFSNDFSSKRNLNTFVLIGEPSVTSLQDFSTLIHLRELWVVECQVKSTSGIQNCVGLQKLFLYSNLIEEIPNLTNCTHLKTLHIAGNNISFLYNLQTAANIEMLNIANNKLKHIDELFSNLKKLKELNMSRNPISSLEDVKFLETLPNLESVAFSDPIYGECPFVRCCNYRLYVVDRLSTLITLDHYKISREERIGAINLYKSCLREVLNTLTLKTLHNVEDFETLKELTLTNCSIKKIDLRSNCLPNLISVNLSGNEITSMWGLHFIQNIQRIVLSHNEVDNFTSPDVLNDIAANGIFMKLRSLFLDHNEIYSLKNFNFQKMPALRHLFLQHNELCDIEGLQKNKRLEVLVADYNNIREVHEENFHHASKMKILFLENNQLQNASFLRRLGLLEKVFLADNQIEEKDDLQKLSSLKNLKELTLLGNPVCEKTNHYKIAFEAYEKLEVIDGTNILSCVYF